MDFTLTFKGLELNIKVFFTFLSDIYDSIILPFFFTTPQCMNLKLHSLYFVVYIATREM